MMLIIILLIQLYSSIHWFPLTIFLIINIRHLLVTGLLIRLRVMPLILMSDVSVAVCPHDYIIVFVSVSIFICLCGCLSICWSVCLSDYLYICACVSFCLPMCLSAFLCPSIHCSVSQSLFLSAYVCLCECTYLFILSICVTVFSSVCINLCV